MADELDVVGFPVGEGCVYVCDVAEDDDLDEAGQPEPPPQVKLEVSWDHDTGTCGVCQVDVSADPDGSLRFACYVSGGVRIFEGGADQARAEVEATRARLASGGGTADPCFTYTLRDHVAVLESALERYTGPNRREPIMAAL
jgi:hypothetical protein